MSGAYATRQSKQWLYGTTVSALRLRKSAYLVRGLKERPLRTNLVYVANNFVAGEILFRRRWFETEHTYWHIYHEILLGFGLLAIEKQKTPLKLLLLLQTTTGQREKCRNITYLLVSGIFWNSTCKKLWPNHVFATILAKNVRPSNPLYSSIALARFNSSYLVFLEYKKKII